MVSGVVFALYSETLPALSPLQTKSSSAVRSDRVCAGVRVRGSVDEGGVREKGRGRRGGYSRVRGTGQVRGVPFPRVTLDGRVQGQG